jgi:hypothetical protein
MLSLRRFFVSVIELGFTTGGQRIPWCRVRQSAWTSPRVRLLIS